LAGFALLCLLFIACAWLLSRFSGVGAPLNVTLGYGAMLFLAQFIAVRGTRGGRFFLASALFFLLAAWLIHRERAAGGDGRNGALIFLAASLLAWAAFWLVGYRRWPFPLFRVVLAVAVLLGGLDLYWAFVHRPLPSHLIAEDYGPLPRVIEWHPGGDFFVINRDEEFESRGALQRYDLKTASMETLAFPGVVTQAAFSPDGHALAVIYEDGRKWHRLTLMDPEGRTRQEILALPRTIYFPFRGAQSPWSPNGLMALFTDAFQNEVTLRSYDRRTDRVQMLAEGKGSERAYWHGPERVAVPRGSAPEAPGPYTLDRLNILSATDGLLEATQAIEPDCNTLFAYSGSDSVLLKQGIDRVLWTNRKLRSATPITVESISYLQVDFSPDGNRMVYAENSESAWRGGSLKMVDRSTGESRVLFHALLGHVSSPAWSPGGKWIAFSLMSPWEWLAKDATVLVISLESGRCYRVGVQSRDTGEFYRVLGRRGLAWRPGGRICCTGAMAVSGRMVSPLAVPHCPVSIRGECGELSPLRD
jgi:dipeptidyl aminopeptidase/acylaminoacyl peptidase